MKVPDGSIIIFEDLKFEIRAHTRELICCHSCTYADGKNRRCKCPGGLIGELGELDFCSKAVKAVNL